MQEGAQQEDAATMNLERNCITEEKEKLIKRRGGSVAFCEAGF